LEVAQCRRIAIFCRMKTANVDAVPQQWSDILGWLGAGEEVELRRGEMTVAKVIPIPERHDATKPVWPDFVSRAQRIWVGQTGGGSLTEALLRERGERA
jgi:antitoxin (DNA-binding transcriptional repressor) of toxin-antitoxin stability system